MTKNHVVEMTVNAYRANELKKLFMGEPPYFFVNLKHIPANVNTDIGAILVEGLYVLYKKGNQDIPEELKKTIYELLNGSPEEIWTAYFIIMCQFRNEKRGGAPFECLDKEILINAKCKVFANRDNLENCFSLVGSSYKNGLWGDIERLDNLLYKKYGASIL